MTPTLNGQPGHPHEDAAQIMLLNGFAISGGGRPDGLWRGEPRDLFAARFRRPPPGSAPRPVLTDPPSGMSDRGELA